MAAYVLKPGREKSLLHRHPWVFSGAIARADGDITPGATVDIRADDGRLLARAAASPTSQIRARVWSFDPADTIDAAFVARRLAASFARRETLADSLGASVDSNGELLVDAHQHTSVPGIYAAGDVVKALNQMNVGTAHAAIAATAIHDTLTDNYR